MSALQLWLQNHNRRLTQDAIDEALMEYITHVEKQRDELLVKVAAWEQKAANWMASPEAAQRLDGYRDLAQRLNIAEQQRDELLAALEAGRRLIELISPFEGDVTRQIDKAIASVKGGE